MSATNRSNVRKPYDFYATPIDVVENLLNNYTLPDGGVLEPSAGNGNIIKALRNKGYINRITALEIREEEESTLSTISDNVIISDFINYDFDNKFKVIIGNPPYSKAREFIERCFDIVEEDGVIIMLLRTAFLESKTRYNFWQKHPLSGLYSLSKRPSFTGKSSDATSYSWFIWDLSKSIQEIKVI